MPAPKIYLIEDDEIIVKTTKWRLEKLGYELCGQASTGEEGILGIEKALPDLILIDIGLGGSMDGIAVGRTVKQRYTIPFIYLTAQADPETLARAKATQPSGYIVKPFEDRNLKVAIEIALR